MTHDPVHYETDPSQWEKEEGWRGPGWYFWTETWADRCGPYETEAEAREQLKRYVLEVLGV